MSSALLSDIFTVGGLVIDLMGAVVLGRGLIISKNRAIELSVSRMASNTREENIEHPQAQDRLKQSRAAKWGLSLLAMGFLGQIVGALIE